MYKLMEKHLSPNDNGDYYSAQKKDEGRAHQEQKVHVFFWALSVS